MSTIRSIEELRELYRQPSDVVKAKKSNIIGPETAASLAASPFALLATSGVDGTCDVSPRGGPAGMLLTLDERTVALPDLGGNNLIDSLTNIVANPHAGLLVLQPGTDETVRIDGRATLRTDDDILDRWDGLFRRPKLAVVIEVEAVFIHCAKAFRRSGLWDPTTWGADAPDAAALFNEHLGGGLDVDGIRGSLEASYEADLAAEKP